MTESISNEDLYHELKRLEERMVTREDLDAIIDSVEILANPETMEALRKSDGDVKEGRVKEVASVQDMLDEL